MPQVQCGVPIMVLDEERGQLHRSGRTALSPPGGLCTRPRIQGAGSGGVRPARLFVPCEPCAEPVDGGRRMTMTVSSFACRLRTGRPQRRPLRWTHRPYVPITEDEAQPEVGAVAQLLTLHSIERASHSRNRRHHRVAGTPWGLSLRRSSTASTQTAAGREEITKARADDESTVLRDMAHRLAAEDPAMAAQLSQFGSQSLLRPPRGWSRRGSAPSKPCSSCHRWRLLVDLVISTQVTMVQLVDLLHRQGVDVYSQPILRAAYGSLTPLGQSSKAPQAVHQEPRRDPRCDGWSVRHRHESSGRRGFLHSPGGTGRRCEADAADHEKRCRRPAPRTAPVRAARRAGPPNAPRRGRSATGGSAAARRGRPRAQPSVHHQMRGARFTQSPQAIHSELP